MNKVTVNLKESESEIISQILKALAKELNTYLKSKEREIEKVTKDLLYDAITSNETWNDIIHGNLRIDLGIVNPSAKLASVLDTLLNSVVVNTKKISVSRDALLGGMIIQAVESSYADILSLSEAVTVSEKGVELEWLRWLLLEGSSIIIGGYDVEYKSGFGRTKGGIMTDGDGWQIDPIHAGTRDDNFLTRSIDSIQIPLQEAIKNVLSN